MNNSGAQRADSKSSDPFSIQPESGDNHHSDDPILTQHYVRRLNEVGYLLQERVVPLDLLTRLRNAVDELTERETRPESIEKYGLGGFFIRNLLDKHEAFHELLNFAPTLSLARATLGYRVQIHALFLRVTYPELKNQEMAWHFHQRLNRDPRFGNEYTPIVLDNLFYLDDVTDENGPLCVLPKSHLLQDKQPVRDFGDKPGQEILKPSAGSIVTLQGSTLHRAFPTRPGSSKRRLIMLAYSPIWMTQADVPVDELSQKLRRSDSREVRELLGRKFQF